MLVYKYNALFFHSLQVCRRWYNLTSKQELWRGQVAALGYREGLGNLVRAITSVKYYTEEESSPRPQVVIDWKQAYRDLLKLMSRLKAMVINKGKYMYMQSCFCFQYTFVLYQSDLYYYYFISICYA